ncbi:G-protein coupled receptor 161 [Striga asiatica]|uniref:G-protein coupled receptor 161 n=1 Tax=Striga asiatica TaxID=4170 RepID=A0A5A7PGQ5_STRAF|nr:G-protein coupled receptor 161 [Striga asiatica]
MNILKHNFPTHCYPLRRLHQPSLRPHFLNFASLGRSFRLPSSISATPYSLTKSAETSKVLAIPISIGKDEERETEDFEEYLAEDGEVYQKTLRLVECAMFAAVSALAFLLSNSLAIEKYFACFFALPIVLSTMRWGVGAGRKTMVATTVLLFVLSGPVKAVTYLRTPVFHNKKSALENTEPNNRGILYKFLKLAVSLSLVISWLAWSSDGYLLEVRSIGALGNVVIASYLIGENILALITINLHALVTYILSGFGCISVPSMNFIYFIFGLLLLLNSGVFVFLLHLLYALFFTRLGMKASLRLPKWLQAAI